MSRLFTRGSGVESPTNTFTITTSEEQTLATGLGEVEVVINTDGSFIADLTLAFLFPEPATDFPNDTEWINLCGDYEIQTSTLPSAAGHIIADSLTFGNGNEFDDFVNQLRADFSIEIKLK
jgi:hypothetical protein